MKSFNQFREELSSIDQKRLDMRNDAAKQKLKAEKNKRKSEITQRMDQLERDLPDETAAKVIDALKRQ